MRGTLDRSPLTKLEKQAVKTFVATLTERYGAKLDQVDLFGLEDPSFRETRDVQVLVLAHREDGELEDRVMDLVLDVLLDSGIYLTVKTFSSRRFDSFRKAKVPMIERMQADRVQLWKAA